MSYKKVIELGDKFAAKMVTAHTRLKSVEQEKIEKFSFNLIKSLNAILNEIQKPHLFKVPFKIFRETGFGHRGASVQHAQNIGDRTALSSKGWFEPFDGGPRALHPHSLPDRCAAYLGTGCDKA